MVLTSFEDILNGEVIHSVECSAGNGARLLEKIKIIFNILQQPEEQYVSKKGSRCI